MNQIILKIMPVILVFVLGYILKRIGLLKKEDGDLFLKLVFYVSLPALLILSITRIELSLDFIYLPFIAAAIMLVTFAASYLLGTALHLKRRSFGVFLVGTMIMNIGFTLPFFIAAYGEEGLARASLFDFGNGLLVFTFVYYLACKYGSSKNKSRDMMKKFVSSPPIWALIIAMLLNLVGVRLPVLADDFFQIVGNMTIPLIMLALGIYLSLKLARFLHIVSAILVRMVFGLLLGFLFVKLFSLEGLSRLIVLIGSAAPVGYNTLTFSSLENLDKEFAASLVSISVLIGIFFIPLLIFLLS
jgi:malate permease and related proteins